MPQPQVTPELVSFRLSPQQQALLAGGERAGAAQCAVVLHGALDAARLRSALGGLVGRHEILRTTFARPAGVLVAQQVVHAHQPIPWHQAGADAGLTRDPEALDALLAGEAGRPLDLAAGPLFSCSLRALAEDRHLLVITAAAACADGESLLIALRELAAADAPGEPLQYADYAEWRHALLTGEEADEDLAAGRAFWSADDPPWSAPRLLFGQAAESQHGAGARAPIALAATAPAGIRRAAAEHGVTEAVFLEACWHATVARLSGETELTLGRTESGRRQADLTDAVGPYAQVVPTHTSHPDGASLAELVDQISRSRSRASRLQDYAAADELSGFADRVPIGFAFADVRLPAPAGAASAEVVALTQRPLPTALQLAIRDDGRRLAAELVSDPAAYDPRDVATIAGSFVALLEDALAGTRATGRLRITTDPQRARLVAAAAGPAGADPATPVHARFEAQARRAPERVAVRAGEQTWTYAELDGAADRVAGRLRALGVAPGRCVGLCLDRSPAMLAGLLGILKAGGAYVPLNFEHPAARLAHQLEETGAAALVTQPAYKDRLPAFGGAVVCVDGGEAADAAVPQAQPAAGPDDLAYVMYTSGSTGLPKGVAITHRSLSTYAQGMVDRLAGSDPDPDAGLRYALISAISTDLGNTCVFPALASGGCLQLIAPDVAMDPDGVAAAAAEHPYDVLKITPSHLRTLLGAQNAARVLPRRCLVLGGEALPWSLVEQVRALAPDLAVLNHYGPTESTIGCCAFELRADSARSTGAATVPIGRALAGDRVHVLDAHLEPVPAGVPGELCVGGSGVARGYVGRPEETAERFVADPFSPVAGDRLYRTGDRVRRLRDGELEFLGRLDDQLKIRGHRVEPGEIEGALLRHPAVRQAAVAAREADGGGLRLVAYVVGAPAPAADELRAALSAALPEHMVPPAFVTLDALPFTPSGKVDRRALPEPASVEPGAGYVAPRDALEEEIAGIWAGLLKLDRVGVHDDFFAIGGHSLLATQAIMAIRRRHGAVPLRALLASPTVAALADAVRHA